MLDPKQQYHTTPVHQTGLHLVYVVDTCGKCDGEVTQANSLQTDAKGVKTLRKAGYKVADRPNIPADGYHSRTHGECCDNCHNPAEDDD